jgi:hypothetical protein
LKVVSGMTKQENLEKDLEKKLEKTIDKKEALKAISDSIKL